MAEKRVDSDFKDGLDGLQEQVQTLESRANDQALSTSQTQMLEILKDTISDGETLYEESIAASATVGSTSNHPNTFVLRWLSAMNLQSVVEDPEADSAVASRDDIGMGSSSSRNAPVSPALPNNVHLSLSNAAIVSAVLPDAEDELALTVAKRAMSAAMLAFQADEYTAAKTGIVESLEMIKALPTSLHAGFDLMQAQWIRAACVFRTEPRARSEPYLINFTEKHTSTKQQRLNVCLAAYLLAQIYIEQGKLENARLSCETALQARRMSLGPDNDLYHRSLALMSRIQALRCKPSSSEAFLSMIPGSSRSTHSVKAKLFQVYEGPTPSHVRQSWVDLPLENRSSVRAAFRINRTISVEGFPVREAFLKGHKHGILAAIQSAGLPAFANDTDTDGCSPLHLAALFGDYSIAEMLLKNGAEPCKHSRPERSDWMRPFVGKESVSLKDWREDYHSNCHFLKLTSLQCATLGMHPETLRLLSYHSGGHIPAVEECAYLLLRPEYHKGTVLSGAKPNTIKNMLFCIQQLGWNVTKPKKAKRETPLHVLCRKFEHGSRNQIVIAFAEFLLTAGTDLLATDSKGMIPLSQTLKCPAIDANDGLVRLLFSRDASRQVASRDKWGNTPIHHAVERQWGHCDFESSETERRLGRIRSLLAAGADPYAQNDAGLTWLQILDKQDFLPPKTRLKVIKTVENSTVPQLRRTVPESTGSTALYPRGRDMSPLKLKTKDQIRWTRVAENAWRESSEGMSRGWEARVDPSGRTFYARDSKPAVSWTHPGPRENR